MYITVLTITFSYLTVGGAKLICILNRTIYPQHTSQMHTLTQAQTGHRVLPQVLLPILAISRREQGLRVCALSSQSESVPNGWGTLQPTSLALGRQLVAAKCSFFLEVQDTCILHHGENIPSLDVVHKVTFFFDPSVRTRIRILERDIVYQKTFFPFRENNFLDK